MESKKVTCGRRTAVSLRALPAHELTATFASWEPMVAIYIIMIERVCIKKQPHLLTVNVLDALTCIRQEKENIRTT